MKSLSEIEKRILAIKQVIIDGKKEIRAKPIAMPFIEKQIAALERSFADELDLLETQRRFIIESKGSSPTGQKESLATSTIFYAWEADLPSGSNRALIKDMLEQVISDIRSDISVTEDPRLDHDTSGVPGSPDIQSTIFEKISKALIFVCDVSIISPSDSSRPTPNPNVLIELGYAIKVLGWNNIIMIMNAAYGDPEKLPFDIRGKRVLKYSYSYSKEEGDKSTEKNALKKQLQDAISLCLKHSTRAQPESLVTSFGDFKSYKSIRIYNTSNEVIEDLEISISWLQEGVRQSRVLNSFFSESQNPVLEHSTNYSFLKPGQEIISANPPHYSDDGKIELRINGRGSSSGNDIRFSKILKNEAKPK